MNKIIFFFFFALFISIECKECTDMHKQLLDGCSTGFNIANFPSSRSLSIQQKADSFWQSCKFAKSCVEEVKCDDAKNGLRGAMMFCFATVIEKSSYSHCLNTYYDSACERVIFDGVMKISRLVEADKKKTCDFMKNETKNCYEKGIKKTEGCGDKEVKEFFKLYDDLLNILGCE